MKLSVLLYLILLSCNLSLVADPGEWSSYRGNNARQSFLNRPILEGDLPSESTEVKFQLRWSFHAPQGPSPAWGAPAPKSYWQRLESIEPRVTDDRRFALVCDDRRLYFGSSADDQIRALDLKTGRLLWSFGSEGPIRYAPALSTDSQRLCFSSDDGYLYCLDAETGKLNWRQSIGKSRRRVVGNGRIISEFPSRTGVLIVGDRVYAGAGLYPQQGCFLISCDVADGGIIWRKTIDDSPQGYLLAGEEQLIVPTGRGNPVAFQINDGELIHRYSGIGGAYAVLTDRELIAGRGNDGSLAVSDQTSRERLAQFAGSHLVIGPQYSFMAGRDSLIALDRIRYMQLNRDLKQRQASARDLKQQLQLATKEKNAKEAERLLEELESSSDKITKIESQLAKCIVWQKNGLGSLSTMVSAKDALIISEPNQTSILNPETGADLGKIPTLQSVADIALAGNSILLSLESGDIQCWSLAESKPPASTPSPTNLSLDREVNEDFLDERVDGFLADQIKSVALDNPALRKGFGLFEFETPIHSVQLNMAISLMESTELHWVWRMPDSNALERWKEILVERGVYGSRVHIFKKTPEDELPGAFTDYLFNWIWVSQSQWDHFSNQQRIVWEQICRPYGGQIWGWEKSETTPPIMRSVYIRKELSGAGSWTHQYADSGNTAAARDRRIKPPFKIQWFGGPGADRMVDRHLRGPGPLAYAGRLIVPGENQFMAVDVYNGAALWRKGFPGSQRYTLPFDAPYYGIGQEGFFLAAADQLKWVDPDTGEELASWSAPLTRSETRQLEPDSARDDSEDFSHSIHWGYVAPFDGAVIASLQWDHASRTEPSRDLINVDYSNHQPIATSQALVRWNPRTAEREWIYAGGRLLNTTFTAGEEEITFLESRTEAAERATEGRIAMKDFNSVEQTYWVNLDARTGQELWRCPLGEFMAAVDNVVYLTRAGDTLVAVGSLLNTEAMDTEYRIEAFDAGSGEVRWRRSHLEGKPRAFAHGEQNHHPVVLQEAGWVIAEPYAYRLEDGEPLTVDHEGQEKWKLVRPGHSCGTITAGAECLFFRANNPTSLDMSSTFQFAEQKRINPMHVDQPADWEFQKLAPTRPGCWINIIPACGLALIPEASSGCVCHYSLQTSMAFLPIGE